MAIEANLYSTTPAFSLQLLPLVYNPYLYSKALTCTLQPLPVF